MGGRRGAGRYARWLVGPLTSFRPRHGETGWDSARERHRPVGALVPFVRVVRVRVVRPTWPRRTPRTEPTPGTALDRASATGLRPAVRRVDRLELGVHPARPRSGRTRFIVRSRVSLGPWWLAAAYWSFIIPADFVMARQMTRGVKQRAEKRVLRTSPSVNRERKRRLTSGQL